MSHGSLEALGTLGSLGVRLGTLEIFGRVLGFRVSGLRFLGTGPFRSLRMCGTLSLRMGTVALLGLLEALLSLGRDTRVTRVTWGTWGTWGTWVTSSAVLQG